MPSRTPVKYSRDYSINAIKVDFGLFRKNLKSNSDNLLADLMFSLGITVSEAISIEVGHIDFRKKILNIPLENTKNRISRSISLSADIIESLKKQIKLVSISNKGPYLFFTRQSNKVTTRRVEQLFKEASTKKLSVTPKTLREWSLKIASMSGVDFEEIKERTGIYSLRKSKLLDVGVVDKVASNLPIRENLLISLFYKFGLDVTSIINLTKTQLQNIFQNTKLLSKSEQNSILKFLEEKSLQDYVFSTRQSEQISQRRIEQIIKNSFSQISEDVTSNTLLTLNKFIFNAENTRLISNDRNLSGPRIYLVSQTQSGANSQTKKTEVKLQKNEK